MVSLYKPPNKYENHFNKSESLVYSLGVIYYVLIKKELPKWVHNKSKDRDELDVEPLGDCESCGLVKEMLKFFAKERPSMDQIIDRLRGGHRQLSNDLII